jgi:hypothetical protein
VAEVFDRGALRNDFVESHRHIIPIGPPALRRRLVADKQTLASRRQ